MTELIGAFSINMFPLKVAETELIGIFSFICLPWGIFYVLFVCPCVVYTRCVLSATVNIQLISFPWYFPQGLS
jgi:hypothetical protein